MTNIWILAANSARATLFSADSPISALTQLAEFDNPNARAKQSELGADRPGRTFDRHGEGRHAMEFELGPKEREQLRFAKALAGTLEKGRVENAFDRLVLVASPSFLGMLREELDAPLRSTVSLELHKDYCGLRPEELRARLPERL